MTGKGERHKSYALHGDGLESIHAGFDDIGMPGERRGEAMKIISEVLDANGVQDFRWYKPPATDELACYWDSAAINMLWVTAGEVHVDVTTSRPPRPLTWQKQDGKYVGWLLPGAVPGAGGAAKQPTTPTVLCPETFIHNPAGTICPTCDIIHE